MGPGPTGPGRAPVWVLTATLALGLMLAGCSDETAGAPPEATGSTVGGPEGPQASDSAPEAADQMFPDILAVELVPGSDRVYTAIVTVSSPYDTPQRYADGWRVLAPDGTVLGEHMLGHDHAGEQPFTRTQSGLEIPDGVQTVTVEGRDQANGYGGKTLSVDVP